MVGTLRFAHPTTAKEILKMLASQRDLFEMPRDICYLNSASYSPLPLRTQEAGRFAVGRKGTPWTLEPAARAKPFTNRFYSTALPKRSMPSIPTTR